MYSARSASAAATGALVTGVPAVAASDPGSSRLVYGAVGGLVLIGVAFVTLAVWLIRQTRVDPVVLAPLERMGDGDWRRKDPATQRRLLDEVRPEGAEPLDPVPAPPGVDDEFEHAERSVRSLDDLVALRAEEDGTPSDGESVPDLADDPGDSTPDESSVDAADDGTADDGTADDDESGPPSPGPVEASDAVETDDDVEGATDDAGEAEHAVEREQDIQSEHAVEPVQDVQPEQDVQPAQAVEDDQPVADAEHR